MRPIGRLAVDAGGDGQAGEGLHLPGAASASARKMLGAMYQPVRVRMLTEAGRRGLRIEPSGAFTVNGR